METGTLILVNGGSSAGKSTLARAFQDLDPQCWTLLGIDLFWGALPPGQLNLHHVRPDYYTGDSVIEEDGLEYFTIRPGPYLDQAMRARYLAIRAYLDQGMNVIADDVIWKDRHAGWNRGSARAAHADAHYDVELDTTVRPSHLLAGDLQEQMASAGEPRAFSLLRKRYLDD